MKKSTIEDLLPELDKLTEQFEATEALKPQLEAEITEALASGDLDDTLALSLQTKRAKLELIPAKLDQVEKRIIAVKEAIKEDFTVRRQAFSRKGREMREKVAAEIRKVLDPFVPENPMHNHAVTSAIENLIIPHSYTIKQICIMESLIDSPVSFGNYVQAARNLLEPERLIETLPLRHEKGK